MKKAKRKRKLSDTILGSCIDCGKPFRARDDTSCGASYGWKLVWGGIQAICTATVLRLG